MNIPDEKADALNLDALCFEELGRVTVSAGHSQEVLDALLPPAPQLPQDVLRPGVCGDVSPAS